MSTLHLYFRTQLTGDDLGAVEKAADALQAALLKAGDVGGSVTLVSDDVVATVPDVPVVVDEAPAAKPEPPARVGTRHHKKES